MVDSSLNKQNPAMLRYAEQDMGWSAMREIRSGLLRGGAKAGYTPPVIDLCGTGTGRGCATDHEDLAENNPNACRACHGKNGEGSVLSRAATDRVLETKEDEYSGGTLHVSRGTPITCTMRHENER